MADFEAAGVDSDRVGVVIAGIVAVDIGIGCGFA